MARRDFGLHKKGTRWHADFWVEKIHIHKSTKTADYDLALETAQKWHVEALRKARGLPMDSDITCEDLFNKWLAWATVHRSESHRLRVQADWDLHILPMIGKRLAKTLRDADAEELRTAFLAAPSRRNEHYGCAQRKPRTLEGANKVMRHLRLVFRWGVYPAELLAAVPFRVIVEDPPEKPKAFLEQAQLRPFLAAVDAGRSLHMKVAVRLQLYLGLREKEALTLEWNAFNPDLTEVQPPGKTGNAPPLPVHPDLAAWLRKLGEKREGLVLPGADGKPHSKRYTVKAIERGAINIKMDGRLSPHRMRDSYATLLAKSGTEAHTLQKALRHDLLETSQIYVHLNTNDIRAAQERVFGKTSQNPHKMLQKRVVKILNKKLKI